MRSIFVPGRALALCLVLAVGIGASLADQPAVVDTPREVDSPHDLDPEPSPDQAPSVEQPPSPDQGPNVEQPPSLDQAPSVGQPPSIDQPVIDQALDGGVLYKRKCTSCHPPARPLSKVRAVAATERGAYLERFLASHFCPDADERRAITQYLLSEAGKE